MHVSLRDILCSSDEYKGSYKQNQQHRIFVFLLFTFFEFMGRDKKLQDIMRRTFNTKSVTVLSMKKCIENVVPAPWNENHFLGPFSWFTLWPTSL